MNRLALTALLLASFAAACSASSDESSDKGSKPKTTSEGTIPTDRDDDDDAKSGPKDDAKTPIAEALTVKEVAVFQAVKISLAQDGVEAIANNAPIVANRPGLVRVYVEPQVTWTKARALTGELTIKDAKGRELAKVTANASILKGSTDAVLQSTFNFELGAEAFSTEGFTYSFRASLAKDAVEGDEVRFPAEGVSQLAQVLPDAGTLHVKLVPVRYNADGTGRLPDTGEAAVEAYRNMVYRMYPASKVDVTVRAPIEWSSAIRSNGTGWEEILDTIYKVRDQDNPANDVYYVGLFAPAQTMQQYCGGGCVLGLAPLAGAFDTAERVATVAGISYRVAADSLAHEVGHAHGRNHSPCGGASGADPSYPYGNALIGSWGYDILDKVLFSPDETHDFMGYCEPTFVSDFTFSALYARMAQVKKQPGNTPSNTANTKNPSVGLRHRVFRVKGDGTTAALSTKTGPMPEGTSVVARYIGGAGQNLRPANARFIPFDHLPGGYLYVPEDAAAAGVDVEGVVPGTVHVALK